MRCTRVNGLIEKLMDGRLAPRLAEKAREHARSCDLCAGRIAAARRLADALAANARAEEKSMRAPPGFADLVMDAVYKEALAPTREMQAAAREAPAPARAASKPPLPARMYRRLGLSFVMSASVLGAGIFFGGSQDAGLVERSVSVTERGSSMVKSALNGAGAAVREVLHPFRGGSVKHDGGESR